MCLISKVATCGKLLNPTVSYADFAVCDRCCYIYVTKCYVNQREMVET